MELSRRSFLGTSLAAGILAGIGTTAEAIAFAEPAMADAASDIASIKALLVAYYISKDWIDDGTNESYFGKQSEVGAYLSSLAADGSWADVDYTATSGTSLGASLPAYLALTRIQSMAAAYVNPTGPLHGNAPLLDGINRALTYWFGAGVTSANGWDGQIGIPLYFCRIGLMVADLVTPTLKAKIITALPSTIDGQTGENGVWDNGTVLTRGLIAGDSGLVALGRDGIALSLEPAGVGDDGYQADRSYHQHGDQLYISGYGRVLFTDMARFLWALSGTSFAFTGTTLQNETNYLLDGIRWVLKGDTGEFNCFLNPAPFYQYNSQRMLDALGWMKAANPGQAAEINKVIANINGTSTDLGLRGHKYLWDSDFSSHQRETWAATVKMVSARTVGAEFRTANPSNLNYLYWVPFGTTFIAQRGDEYRNIFPLWDWTKIPGATNPAVVVPISATAPYRQSTTFVGGVDNGLYGAAALDMNKYNTQARKGYFFFDNEFVALGAGIASTDAHTVTTSINQTIVNGPVVAAGTAVPSGTNAGVYAGTWAFHDTTGYVFFQNTSMNVKNLSVTGAWSDIAEGQDSTPITDNVFGIWLDHGIAPTDASYAYAVLPNSTQAQVSVYANAMPVRVISNTSSLQAVRHDGLKVAELLFYSAGTATIRSGLTVTVDQPCLVIVDESSSGTPVVTVANPATPNLTVNVSLNASGTVTDYPVTLPGLERQGQSVVASAPTWDMAARRPVVSSSVQVSGTGAHFLTDGNPNTRWGSAYADNQWVQVDLMSVTVVDGVTINWEAAYATVFSVDISLDATNWTTVWSTSSGTGGNQAIDFTAVPARFVRLTLAHRATIYGFSIYDLFVHGLPDLALTGTASATSSAAGVPVTNLNDGDLATRWGSSYSDPQTAMIDLGSIKSIVAVVLYWTTACAKTYTVDISSDGSTWITIYATTAGVVGTLVIPTVSSARYVRMHGTARATPYGYSLNAIQVYGS